MTCASPFKNGFELNVISQGGIGTGTHVRSPAFKNWFPATLGHNLLVGVLVAGLPGGGVCVRDPHPGSLHFGLWVFH